MILEATTIPSDSGLIEPDFRLVRIDKESAENRVNNEVRFNELDYSQEKRLRDELTDDEYFEAYGLERKPVYNQGFVLCADPDSGYTFMQCVLYRNLRGIVWGGFWRAASPISDANDSVLVSDGSEVKRIPVSSRIHSMPLDAVIPYSQVEKLIEGTHADTFGQC